MGIQLSGSHIQPPKGVETNHLSVMFTMLVAKWQTQITLHRYVSFDCSNMISVYVLQILSVFFSETNLTIDPQ